MGVLITDSSQVTFMLCHSVIETKLNQKNNTFSVRSPRSFTQYTFTKAETWSVTCNVNTTTNPNPEHLITLIVAYNLVPEADCWFRMVFYIEPPTVNSQGQCDGREVVVLTPEPMTYLDLYRGNGIILVATENFVLNPILGKPLGPRMKDGRWLWTGPVVSQQWMKSATRKVMRLSTGDAITDLARLVNFPMTDLWHGYHILLTLILGEWEGEVLALKNKVDGVPCVGVLDGKAVCILLFGNQIRCLTLPKSVEDWDRYPLFAEKDVELEFDRVVAWHENEPKEWLWNDELGDLQPRKNVSEEETERWIRHNIEPWPIENTEDALTIKSFRRAEFTMEPNLSQMRESYGKGWIQFTLYHFW